MTLEFDLFLVGTSKDPGGTSDGRRADKNEDEEPPARGGVARARGRFSLPDRPTPGATLVISPSSSALLAHPARRRAFATSGQILPD